MSVNEQGSWAKTINAVKSPVTLSALAMLVILSAFSVMSYKQSSPSAFYVLLIFAFAVVLINLFFFVSSETVGSEVTFRVRVTKTMPSGVFPIDAIEVTLFKNGKKLRTRLTNDQGEVAFTEKLNRKDELYVSVNDNSGTIRKAALFSEGQCQIVKTILFG